ncbi:hypothetical protein BD289DRAFT_5355 [Coniella lustricola]|uniref:Uncharacterized protein n=1 Tax=Coniella lustricola TaxID=2025994 RepID=A0A2T3ANV9_9PEZI|nr:hypothetical protein BD289DRAFT_5355 [Coniella lustricola]
MHSSNTGSRATRQIKLGLAPTPCRSSTRPCPHRVAPAAAPFASQCCQSRSHALILRIQTRRSALLILQEYKRESGLNMALCCASRAPQDSTSPLDQFGEKLISTTLYVHTRYNILYTTTPSSRCFLLGDSVSSFILFPVAAQNPVQLASNKPAHGRCRPRAIYHHFRPGPPDTPGHASLIERETPEPA